MPTLNWIGKEAVVKHHREVPFRLLEPVADLSCGPADSGNLIVQGDNLHALKALLPRYAGQVKCIYIDPPYNTGNEGWVYNDNVNSPEIRKWLGEVVGKEGETLDRHDRWLCMMYPRLVLLRQFLREDGAIFVSIDDNEVASLRLVMDEIFGAGNFISTFVVQKRVSPDNDERLVTAVHDYLVCYGKNKRSCQFARLARTEEADARYENPDNDPRGPWTSSDLTRREYREHDFYPIKLPSGREVTPAAGRSWSVPRETFQRLLAENRIWFGRNGAAMPRLKRFLSEVSGGMVPTTWFSSDLVGDNQQSKKELRGILHEQTDLFATPKPTKLLQRILQIATDKDSLVLDSFAGSGTTGHAVLKQNTEDGGNRRFILVEMDEGIAQNVTAERVRRVALGYTNAKGQAVAGLGGGFQFCRLCPEPLFDADGQIRGDVTFAQLAEFVWFVETGTGFSGTADSPLLGIFEGRAIYLLYNGILKDKSADGGNVLTSAVFEALPPFAGPKVIYAAACRLGNARLAREGIIFKQTPYALEM
jgi:site-specific DNA-methyltransferase (adenine-specific)/adenine-specific DNA-methyltransferase